MITLHKFLKAMLLSLDLVSGYILKISNFRSFQNQDFHFIIKGLQVLLKTQLITSFVCQPMSPYRWVITVRGLYQRVEISAQSLPVQIVVSWQFLEKHFLGRNLFVGKSSNVLYRHIFTKVPLNSIAGFQLLCHWDTSVLCCHGQQRQTFQRCHQRALVQLQFFSHRASGFAFNWKKNSTAVLHCRLLSFNESRLWNRITILA